jgi:hypothetical protein
MTRQQLKAAEFLYHINSQDPNFFDGPVMTMAKAYENELKVRVAFPLLSELMDCSSFARGCDACMEREVQHKVNGAMQTDIQYYHRIVVVVLVSTGSPIPLEGSAFRRTAKARSLAP